MSKIVVDQKNQTLEITTTLAFLLPEPKTGSDFDLDKVRVQQRREVIAVLKAFKERLIKTIEDRQKACLRHLLAHTDTIIYNDGRHIEYKRNDGTIGNFEVPSYETMTKAIKLLRTEMYEAFLENRVCLDQTIKALLNDPNLDRSDIDHFKYSKLVSILMCFLEGAFANQH